MSFYKGFIIWIIVASLIGCGCFALWKFYLCRVRGFENRKFVTSTGCILIFLTSITYLFLPLVLCKAKLFTHTKDRFVDGIKNDIVSRTRDAFYEDAENVLRDIVDSVVCSEFVSDSYGSDMERKKEMVVKYALKYSKNRTLKDSLENALKLLVPAEIDDESFEKHIQDCTLTECNKIVETYSANIKENYIQNSLLKPWVAPIVKNVSMENFTGLPPDEASVKAFNKAKDAFDKLFLRFAMWISVLTAVLIIMIIFMLRDMNEKSDKKRKRAYMFEYNEKSFEEMNSKKVDDI